MRAEITINIAFDANAEFIADFVASTRRDVKCNAIGATEFVADISTRTTEIQNGWIDQQSF